MSQKNYNIVAGEHLLRLTRVSSHKNSSETLGRKGRNTKYNRTTSLPSFVLYVQWLSRRVKKMQTTLTDAVLTIFRVLLCIRWAKNKTKSLLFSCVFINLVYTYRVILFYYTSKHIHHYIQLLNWLEWISRGWIKVHHPLQIQIPSTCRWSVLNAWNWGCWIWPYNIWLDIRSDAILIWNMKRTFLSWKLVLMLPGRQVPHPIWRIIVTRHILGSLLSSHSLLKRTQIFFLS